jgi:hypothetical protein
MEMTYVYITIKNIPGVEVGRESMLAMNLFLPIGGFDYGNHW